MAIPLIVPLLISAVGAGVGAAVNASSNARAQKEADKAYREQRDALLIDKYADPLELAGNRSLLSQAYREIDKQNQKIDNAKIAGGATFENTLAAKQAANETLSDIVSNVIQGQQDRQDMYNNQLLNIDSQRTNQRIATIQQSGQNWANAINNVSGSVATLGGTMLENDLTWKQLLKG